MQRITTSREISKISSEQRDKGLKIGFVPTMGALHEGHLSLVRKAKAENDIAVCSIFVNPTQFNEPSDFQRYPRTLEKDVEMLESVGCDYLFAPTASEIYPVPDQTVYELGSVAEVLEGKHRPGHFNGVASVVKKLFEVVLPHRAYFGLKDYQQYLVIRKLVENYDLGVEVIGCPIVRSEKGLAMSSRNELLANTEAEHALVLNQSLKRAQALIEEGNSPEKVEHTISEDLSSKGVDLEYFEIRNAEDLSKPDSSSQSLVALVAARFGKIRLIDNMNLTVN
jgi:pantoate--beta-alanine ligase